MIIYLECNDILLGIIMIIHLEKFENVVWHNFSKKLFRKINSPKNFFQNNKK